jgi:hypothetical protein
VAIRNAKLTIEEISNGAFIHRMNRQNDVQLWNSKGSSLTISTVGSQFAAGLFRQRLLEAPMRLKAAK